VIIVNAPKRKDDLRHRILELLRNDARRAFRPKEIAKRLDIRDNREYRVFRSVLAELDDEGVLGRAKNGRYTHRKPRPATVGRLSVKPRGFGFVTLDDGRDYAVSATNMGTALDGDLVQVALGAPSKGRRAEAEVLEVVERGRDSVVGTFMRRGRFAIVRPDDQRVTRDIYVEAGNEGSAQDGDKVVVSLERFEHPHGSPEGRVLRVVGPEDDPRVRVLALAMSIGVDPDFPPEVIDAADRIASEISNADVRRREDLRDRYVLTIDPESAADFDDALHVTRLESGRLEVGIHIADVSHFVGAGTDLDREALRRGTSVYLVDRAIPMLPERLSGDLCSLRPDEDRLCLSVLVEMTGSGEVQVVRIRETVIRSRARLTYEEAQSILDEGSEANHPAAEALQTLAGIARCLRETRMEAGAVDFDKPEIQVRLGEDGEVVDVGHRSRLESNRLIEEFMLLANCLVAAEAQRTSRDRPFVYRIHEHPDGTKVRALADYVKLFGYRLDIRDGRVSSASLNRLLRAVRGTAQEPVIEEAALRAMARARYSTENVGHFGLAVDQYSHFTSPIRRYPDLLVHREIKHRLSLSPTPDVDLEEFCRHCSEQERLADEAERETLKLKLVEYAQKHVGDEFAGVITGVTAFGVFVELNQLLVEGMVHVRDMNDDYYEYDPSAYRLSGVYSGKRYTVGDEVRVIIVSADPNTRRIDLYLTE
jgi:ribonuclease R